MTGIDELLVADEAASGSPSYGGHRLKLETGAA
jgi:hypothetical protein